MPFDQPLRLASYNIHKCVGNDRLRSPHRVLEVINDLGADIIALQEVDMRMGVRPAALPRSMIESYSELTPIDLATNNVSLGWHGNALLLRDGCQVQAITRLELPGLEPRGAVVVDLASPAGSLRIVAVHLGLLRRYRLLQMQEIIAQLNHMPPRPTAILGDFNEWSRRRGLSPLAHQFCIHSPGRSFHAARPVAALDRIALSEELKLVDAGVAKTKAAKLASDHLPIWADVVMTRAN